MLRPFLCASSAVIERPAEKLAIRKTKRMTTVIVMAVTVTWRRLRSCSGGGWTVGVTADGGSLVRFLNDSSSAIITITKTTEQTMKNNHQSRLRFSACGPLGLSAL